MIIIGEKINGAIKTVSQAIVQQNTELIQDLAVKQVAAGADFIDVCASSFGDDEADILKWLIDIIQEVVDAPLSIDSPNPEVIKTVITSCKKPGLINSVSAEGAKMEILYPVAKECGWDVIALTVDNTGIPKDVQTRLRIAEKLIGKAGDYGIKEEQIYIDPLVVALSTDNQSMLNFLNTMRLLKQEFPRVKITSGLSNISFGMPLRRVVNRYFLCLALYEGLDSAIMDPLDKDLRGALLATQALLAKDRHCRTFSTAYRKGYI